MNIWLNTQVLLYTEMGLRTSSGFACLLGSRDNTGLLTGHIGKYFHELLQILVNWDENLRINTDKDLLFLLRGLLVRILVWMETFDMLDDEFCLISWILENHDVG